jgi:predicted phosphoribosyltransferase
MAFYRDRYEAGRHLAERLRAHADSTAIVLALPRGGVPVAAEVASRLNLPLDVFVVRKLGIPRHPELAMGALATGGVRVTNEDVINAFGITGDVLDAVTRAEATELERRERVYRGGRPSLDVRGKTVLLIDDGLATGATMRAAVQALRARDAGHVVVAVPVGAPETCEMLRREADGVVCAVEPEPFLAVGYWYEDFGQTTDEEVQALLEQAASRPRAA